MAEPLRHKNIREIGLSAVSIALPQNPSWRERHAGEELAKYLCLMSGREIPVMRGTGAATTRAHVILIGDNGIARGFVEGELIQSPRTLKSGDAFILRAARDRGGSYLAMWGKTDIGTLYAVYHYLTAFCGVGFFRDGEQVPRRSKIPLLGIDAVEDPRFADRSVLGTTSYGLSKFQSGFWSAEEWKSFLEWLAKVKCNMTNSMVGIHDWGAEAAWRACAQVGMPINKHQSENSIRHINDWPQSWTRRMELQSEMVKEIQDYGRNRGIRFAYSFGYGDVPYELNEAYAGLRPLVRSDSQRPYDNPCVHPDDPLAYRFTVAYLKNVVEMFGTDHIYQCCPYVEQSPGATPRESIELKINASQQLARAVREIDPEGIWRSDSWDFIANLDRGTSPELHWNARTIKDYFEQLPEGVPYIYDVTGGSRDEDLNWVVSEAYRIADYFHDRPWAFGHFWCFQGEVHLHGDIDLVMARTREVAEDPRAANCRGFYDAGESYGHNIFYEWVLLKLAWNPLVTREELIREYALTRYGEASREAMSESVSLMAEAMKITHGEIVYYMFPFWRNVLWDYEGVSRGDPVEQRFEAQYRKSRDLWLERHRKAATLFNASLERALGEKARQEGNTLFENDIVDLGKAVIHELSNAHLILMYKAFKAGDGEGVRREKGKVLELLEEQKKILSTRKDFSMEAMEEEVMGRSGMNPQAPRMMREWQIVVDYSAHDSVERLQYLDMPRIERYASLLEGKLSRGDRGIRLSDYLPGGKLPSGGNEGTWTDIERRWVTGEIHVERTFKGTPIEAVEEAIRNLRDNSAWTY